MTDSVRSRLRLLHWSRFLLVTVVLVIIGIGLSIWSPYFREQHVAQKVKGWGGAAHTESCGPEWLRRIVGDDRMAEFKIFDRIVIVKLEGTAITDAEIAHLSELTNLRKLSLRKSVATDAGLACLNKLTNLDFLNLEGTVVTDAGLDHLRRLKDLRILVLTGTAVTDAGMANLGELTKLRQLWLGPAVTDAGLVEATKLTNLVTLGVRGTAVTDKGIDKFKKALPNCNIWD